MLNASPRLMEAIAAPSVGMASPSMTPRYVVIGKRITAETMRSRMGNSMSKGFALAAFSSPPSSISPGAGPYSSL